MININIKQADLAIMCELKVIIKGKTIMEDVVRITQEKDNIRLQGLLGDTMTVHGRIIDVNIAKQEVIIES